jgi:hypothetical protein
MIESAHGPVIFISATNLEVMVDRRDEIDAKYVVPG